MELSYEFLYNQNTKEVLGKLFQAKFDGATTYNVRKLQYGLEKHFKTLQKEFQDMVKAHADLDEKGELKKVEGQPDGTFNIPTEKVQDWNTAIQALMAKKFSLDKVDKVHISQIVNSDMKLSSQEMQHLEPLLDGMDFED